MITYILVWIGLIIIIAAFIMLFLWACWEIANEKMPGMPMIMSVGVAIFAIWFIPIFVQTKIPGTMRKQCSRFDYKTVIKIYEGTKYEGEEIYCKTYQPGEIYLDSEWKELIE